MPLGLNLNSAIRYIHWTPPGELEGLVQLTTAKCKELGISPGRRSAITPVNQPGAGDPSVNVRGIINFINSVEPITNEDKVTDADRVAQDGKPGDSHDVLLRKADVRAGQEQRLREKTANLEGKKTAQATLLTLHATLLSRCAAAGYKPAEVLPLDPASANLPLPVTSPLAQSMPLASDRRVLVAPGTLPPGTGPGTAAQGAAAPGTAAPGTVPAGTVPAGTVPAGTVAGAPGNAPGTTAPGNAPVTGERTGRRGRGAPAAPAASPDTVPAGTVPAQAGFGPRDPRLPNAPGKNPSLSPDPKPLA